MSGHKNLFFHLHSHPYLVVREERPSGFGGMIFRIVRSG
jgi:hypothetical protein